MATTVAALAKRYRDLGTGGMQVRLEDYARRVLAPLGRRILAEQIRATTRRRSGALVDSARSVVYRSTSTIQVLLEADHPAARTLGRTGSTTIRARRPGGALAIPVGPALDGTGSPRYDSPRQAPVKLHLVVDRAQHATLRDEAGRVWYVLKRSVTIEGRGFFRRTRIEWQRESARLTRSYVARLLEGKV